MYNTIHPHTTAVSAFCVAAAHAQMGRKCKLYKHGGTWYVAI